MDNSNINHTFAVCAYKECEYLEDCIMSLLNQTIKTNIIIETSTPNDYIFGIAKKYNLPIFINNGDSGISNDWNYAFDHADTKLVTIAHQDDIYYDSYVESVLSHYKEDAILLFTDYKEIRNDKHVSNNAVLIIKRIMDFFIRLAPGSIKMRRFVLAFGNAISCPTVTLNKEKVGQSPYLGKYKCSADYDTWEYLSKKKGKFIHIPKKLMAHRIYKESSTTLYLAENIRQKEDLEILSRFWPKPIAKLIYKVYSLSQKSNNN